MPYLSIKAVGEEIHSGIITPTELVAEALERIDALDDDLKAYVTVMRDQAYEDAERLERELRTGLYRSPLHGISSGGSAVAVAMGMSLGAIGTDTGGSIRIPAACCGVTGLKPTYGRVSCHGIIPLSWSLDHVGPLARSAEDCAIVFDAIAGYDPRDPNSISGPPSGPTASLIAGPEGRDTLSLQGLALGVPQEAFFAPLDPEVRAAWQAALLVLREEGAEVVDVELPLAAIEVYRTIQKPEASLAHMQKGWLSERRDDYTALTLQRLLEGQQIPAVAYLHALHQRHIFSNSMRTVLRQVDALVLPTLPIPAVLMKQANQEISIDGVAENATTALLRLTMPFNLAGLPAISLPCGFTTNGLPVGLQVAGRPFEESTVLRIAHAYQQLTDWHQRESGV